MVVSIWTKIGFFRFLPRNSRFCIGSSQFLGSNVKRDVKRDGKDVMTTKSREKVKKGFGIGQLTRFAGLGDLLRPRTFSLGRHLFDLFRRSCPSIPGIS